MSDAIQRHTCDLVEHGYNGWVGQPAAARGVPAWLRYVAPRIIACSSPIVLIDHARRRSVAVER
jgi:hypothetical protein